MVLIYRGGDGGDLVVVVVTMVLIVRVTIVRNVVDLVMVTCKLEL